MGRDARGNLAFDAVAVGDALPVLEVPLDATLITAGAIASRDYQDVHHDQAAARRRGTPDIFMNILTTNGWVGRYVSDWAGPDARLEKVSLRLGAPNYPGDVMTLTGRVAEAADGRVEVEVRGANRLGDHVTARVRVALAEGAA